MSRPTHMPPRSSVIGFVAGVATTLAGVLVFVSASSELTRVTTASTVHRPLLAALDRLQVAAARGDDANVVAGLEQLALCWEAYAFADGESPELFVPAIPAARGAACRAADAATRKTEPAP